MELGDPEASFDETTSKPASAKKSKNPRPTTGTLVSHQKVKKTIQIIAISCVV